MYLWRKKEILIYVVDDFNTKCVECGACYQFCDDGAICFKYPAGGIGILNEQG